MTERHANLRQETVHKVAERLRDVYQELGDEERWAMGYLMTRLDDPGDVRGYSFSENDTGAAATVSFDPETTPHWLTDGAG
jgi:hypothetical protein